MNFKRGMLWATAAMATAAVIGLGSVTVVGCNRPGDADEVPGVGNEQAAEQQSAGVDGDTSETAGNALGVEQYRGGSHGGGSHGGGSHSGGSHGTHGGSHASRGFGHAAGGHGYTHGWGRGYGHGGHWGGSRWGRWGGGRWVGSRWVAGPYWGWCDDRYYACNRYWW